MYNVIDNVTRMNEIGLVAFVIAIMALAIKVISNRPFTYGVEVELSRNSEHLTTYTRMAAWLSKATGWEVYNNGYTKGHIHRLKLVSDSTVSPNGVEVVFPVTAGGDYSLLYKALNGLRGLVTANRTCGIHVHIGVLDEDATGITRLGQINEGEMAKSDWIIPLTAWMIRVTHAYDYFGTVISSMLAPSRSSGDHMHGGEGLYDKLYRLPLKYRGELEKHLKAERQNAEDLGLEYSPSGQRRFAIDLLRTLGSGRYYVVNFESLWSYGTIEFRQHHGTSNPTQVKAWVETLQNLVLNCRNEWEVRARPEAFSRTILGFFEFLGYKPNDPIIAYYERRADKHKGKLTKAQACTTCGSNSCDDDDFCPNGTYTNEPFNKWKASQPYEYADDDSDDDDDDDD